MIATIGGIPVYDATIGDDECGMLKISLVDDPAVMSNFQAFDSNKKMMMYAVENDEQRLIVGCIMRADFPIYRRDEKNGEYYIIYKADTIREMAEKYLSENRQNNINLMHEEGSDVEGVQMVQYFIKDSSKGISPSGFDDIAEGSLFGEFHVINDDVWNEIKEGTYKGFSLEGVFELVPDKEPEVVDEIVDALDGKFSRILNQLKNSINMGKFSKFKAGLKKLLEEFGTMTTDKGVITWDGDDDLKVGDAVYVEDAEGNRTAAAEGEYKTSDNAIIVVADGKVAEIKDPEEIPAEGEGEEEVSMAEVKTDKGNLSWSGDEDLKEGDEVFTIGEDGESAPAPDGDYTTEDGKVITVVDGKVAGIKDAEAEVAPEEAEKLRKQTRFSKIREAFSESYDEKLRKIFAAVEAVFAEYQYPIILEAGDDYAVVSVVDEDWNETLYKFAVSWDEEGNAVLGESEEVKPAFVPVDEQNPIEEENAALRKENGELKAEVEKLKKTPAAQPAHEEVKTTVEYQKTGNKKLDNLARVVSAK